MLEGMYSSSNRLTRPGRFPLSARPSKPGRLQPTGIPCRDCSESERLVQVVRMCRAVSFRFTQHVFLIRKLLFLNEVCATARTGPWFTSVQSPGLLKPPYLCSSSAPDA